MVGNAHLEPGVTFLKDDVDACKWGSLKSDLHNEQMGGILRLWHEQKA